MKTWQKIALGIVGFVAVIFVALVLVSRAQAHGLVAHPPEVRPTVGQGPEGCPLPYEDVAVTTADGLHLVGWYVPSQNGAVVMAQHGYKIDRTDMVTQTQVLCRHGYGVLLTTVRAHDESEGELISFGHREMADLDAWYQYLLTREDVDPDRIGALGNSMGGSLVIQYAAQNEGIRAVVAHSAFSSLDDTVAKSIQVFTGLPPFPFAPLIVFWAEREADFRTAEISAKTSIRDMCGRPVLLMQGGQDDVVSVESGAWLYEAACEPKELWFEPGLKHCGFEQLLPLEYEKRVVGFYDRYLLGE